MSFINDEVNVGAKIDELERVLNKEEKVAMISIGDSIGFAPSSYNYLSRIIDSVYFDKSRLAIFNTNLQTFNSEDDVYNIITSNISLEEIKNINKEEIEYWIKKILSDKKITIDKKIIAITKAILKVKERRIREDDKIITLKDMIMSSSCPNIFYSTNNNLVYKSVPSRYQESENEKRKRNYDTILSLNPRSNIYTIGLVNLKKDKASINKVKRQNEFLEELSTSFGMIYIDPEGLNEYLIKGKYTYLSEEGVNFLALKCIEAMHTRNVDSPTTSPCFISGIIPEVYDDAISYLLDCTIQNQISLTQEKANLVSYLDKKFISSRIAVEENHQKILQKIINQKEGAIAKLNK